MKLIKLIHDMKLFHFTPLVSSTHATLEENTTSRQTLTSSAMICCAVKDDRCRCLLILQRYYNVIITRRWYIREPYQAVRSPVSPSRAAEPRDLRPMTGLTKAGCSWNLQSPATYIKHGLN